MISVQRQRIIELGNVVSRELGETKHVSDKQKDADTAFGTTFGTTDSIHPENDHSEKKKEAPEN